MRGEVHILVNCPITTFLKEKQHSACIGWGEYMLVLTYILLDLWEMEKGMEKEWYDDVDNQQQLGKYWASYLFKS